MEGRESNRQPIHTVEHKMHWERTLIVNIADGGGQVARHLVSDLCCYFKHRQRHAADQRYIGRHIPQSKEKEDPPPGFAQLPDY